ncbi:MAG: MarR family transcriptional regulator, partial [Bacilli bacterium]|nr:MarR family transcriptional regulator [Bacilli bacterium]
MNDFKENVFIDLLTTCQLVKKMYSELEKKYCINFIQLAIIFLSGTRNMTVSNLAEELNVSKSAISQALVKLFIMKYVTKVAADENKKSFY